MGAPAPPRAVKKIRRNLQGKFVSAPLVTVNFRTFLGDCEVYLAHLVDFDRILKVTTKNGRQLFEEKCSRDKILATPMR